MKISSEWESTGALPKQLLCNEYLYILIIKKENILLSRNTATWIGFIERNFETYLYDNASLKYYLIVVIETQHKIKLKTLIKNNI